MQLELISPVKIVTPAFKRCKISIDMHKYLFAVGMPEESNRGREHQPQLSSPCSPVV